MAIDFKIEGLEELNNQIKKLAASLSAEAVEPLLLQGATVIADDMRSRVRVGPTGNLRRSIGAKQLKRVDKNPAPAIAAVDRKIAPHAHLIDRGTSRAPAYPFMRPAVDNKGSEVANMIESGIAKLIEEAVK